MRLHRKVIKEYKDGTLDSFRLEKGNDSHTIQQIMTHFLLISRNTVFYLHSEDK